MSTGLRTPAAGDKKPFSACCVPAPSSGTCSPRSSQASAARMPAPPAFVMIATRSPRGAGCVVSSAATSNISASTSVRITPACRKSASTVTSEAATSAPVCDCVARNPAADRPPLTATIGFFRPTRRAIGANFRGLPNDSR